MQPLVIASAHDLIARNCLQWAAHGVPNLTIIAVDFEPGWETFKITITHPAGDEISRVEREIDCLTCATVELLANLLTQLPARGPVLVIVPGGIELPSVSIRLQQAIEMPGTDLAGFHVARAITAVDTQVALNLVVGASDEFDVSAYLHTCRLEEDPQWSDDCDADVREVLHNDLLYADHVVLTGTDKAGEAVVRRNATHAPVSYWQDLQMGPWFSCWHDSDRAIARVIDDYRS